MEKKFDIKYNIFNGLIEKYGKEAQVRQTFEEMAELQAHQEVDYVLQEDF